MPPDVERQLMEKYAVVIALFTGMLFCGGCPQTAKVDVQQVVPVPAADASVQPEPNLAPAPAVAEANAPAVPEPNLPDANTPDVNMPDTNAPVPQASDANKTEAEITGPNDQLAAAVFHAKCAPVLHKYVNKDGLVDYRTLSRRRTELLDAIDLFKSLDPDIFDGWSQNDKTAFWLNAYNLHLLRIILDNYPIQSSRTLRLFWPPDSIRHIKGIWDDYKFIIMDEQFTLREIDNRFFRLRCDDPRVFFAISYASVSGPVLRNEPYYGDTLDQQLDDQVRKFLAGRHAFRIDREKQVVWLSSILKQTWYGQQFVDRYGTDRKFKNQEHAVRAALNFLLNYIPAEDAAYLETGNYSVDYLNYDWALNEQAG